MSPVLESEYAGMIIKDVTYDCDDIRILFVGGKKIDISDKKAYFSSKDNPAWLKGRAFKDLVRSDNMIEIITYDGIVRFDVSKK